MAEPRVTVTEITITNEGEDTGALVLRLAPEGDYLILTQDGSEVLLDADDLPVLLREGMRLLEQGSTEQAIPKPQFPPPRAIREGFIE